MDFQALIAEIVARETPGSVDFGELPVTERQRLVAAYIEQDATDVNEVIANLPVGYQRAVFSQMMLGVADTYDFQSMFRNAALSVYEDTIQGELDDYTRDFNLDNGISEVA